MSYSPGCVILHEGCLYVMCEVLHDYEHIIGLGLCHRSPEISILMKLMCNSMPLGAAWAYYIKVLVLASMAS